jgi:branched-chain amino acid transport system ATP-binding protein
MPTKMSVMEVAMAAATQHHGFWETLLNTVGARAAEKAARDKAAALLDELLLSHVKDLPASPVRRAEKAAGHCLCMDGRPASADAGRAHGGVHPNLRNDIVQVLRRLNHKGMTVVIVEHDMHFIREVCTRCIVLDRGHIVASCRPDELSSNERVLQAYLGGGHAPKTETRAEVEGA